MENVDARNDAGVFSDDKSTAFSGDNPQRLAATTRNV